MNVMTRRGSLDNVVTFQHVCDTRADLANIPLQQISLGSTAIVLHGDKDEFQVYIAKSNKEWILISAGSGGSITPGGGGSGEGGIDTSSDTVTASSLLQGITAHDATGQQIIGEIITRTISDLQKVDSTITIPAGYYATPISYSTAGVPDNDVVFIDYDGTRVYSYTADEFLALTEMPANPDHTAEGLTAQGWNWDLVDAKEYVTNAREIVIGQMYITTDGWTRIYIDVDECHKTIKLNLSVASVVNGSYGYFYIYWGDNTYYTQIEAVDGGETLHILRSDDGFTHSTDTIQHTYNQTGSYIITIIADDSEGTLAIQAPSQGRAILLANPTYAYAYQRLSYVGMITKIHIGKNIALGQAAFGGMYNLKTITIPNTIDNTNDFNLKYLFHECNSLQAIVIPKLFTTCTLSDIAHGLMFDNNYSLRYLSLPNMEVSSISQISPNACPKLTKINIPSCTSMEYVCESCRNIKSIYIPSTVTKLRNYAFSDSNIEILIIPSSVTTIYNYALQHMHGLHELHFTSAKPPAISSPDDYTQLPRFCKIFVPQGKLATYTSATNYPDSNIYQYEEE